MGLAAVAMGGESGAGICRASDGHLWIQISSGPGIGKGIGATLTVGKAYSTNEEFYTKNPFRTSSVVIGALAFVGGLGISKDLNLGIHKKWPDGYDLSMVENEDEREGRGFLPGDQWLTAYQSGRAAAAGIGYNKVRYGQFDVMIALGTDEMYLYREFMSHCFDDQRGKLYGDTCVEVPFERSTLPGPSGSDSDGAP